MKKLVKILTTAIVSVLACCMLVACVPSNVEKAEKKMEKAGYAVLAVSENNPTIGEAIDEADDLVGGFIATKVGGGIIGAITDSNTMIALLFEDKESAKEFLTEDSALLKVAYGDLIQKGKWVYGGTSDAIETFEK